tara:strand:+ start:466 stop:1341 length:876 start_codon:yes stop_codon:yes gene_type:complete
MKNFLNIKPVYFNKPSKLEAFKYLEKQKYLKFSKIKKFINNNFLETHPFGYLVTDNNENIKGFLGTMFSHRSDLNNDQSLYCNLHTWIIDDDVRLRFFSEAKDLLKPIFESKSIIFAKPVLSLIRLFERNFNISIESMSLRFSLLLNFKTFFKKEFYEVKKELVGKILNPNELQIYKDHEKLICDKLVLKDYNSNDYIFLILLKKRKKVFFSYLEIIYTSNTNLLKQKWHVISNLLLKKYKTVFAGQNFLDEKYCFLPGNNLFFKDRTYKIVIKNMKDNSKFNTLYSEFIY